MFKQKQVIHKPFKLITVTSTCISGFIQDNLEKFTSITQNFCLFILSFIIEYEWKFDIRICVYWRISDFVAWYFLKIMFGFHIIPYSLSHSNIWFIVKRGTQRKGFFLNVFWIVADPKVLCNRTGFDNVSVPEMTCNRTVRTWQPGYVTCASNTCMYYLYNYRENSRQLWVLVLLNLYNCNIENFCLNNYFTNNQWIFHEK